MNIFQFKQFLNKYSDNKSFINVKTFNEFVQQLDACICDGCMVLATWLVLVEVADTEVRLSVRSIKPKTPKT